tara:strand:- start:292 stop:576 length:285 start_codon:yes stop_codon:yes gene_type:complete
MRWLFIIAFSSGCFQAQKKNYILNALFGLITFSIAERVFIVRMEELNTKKGYLKISTALGWDLNLDKKIARRHQWAPKRDPQARGKKQNEKLTF